MKTTYRREMKHNFMIIEPEEPGYDRYEMYMMAANPIEGLLKFHIKQVDNCKFYYYEITSRQPLNRVLEYHSLGGEELKKLISGIGQILGRLESYLLSESQILLEPEYMYVEPERFTVFFCLIPGRKGNFPEEMTELLRYLLGKVNHQDKECVVMAYGLYQESLKDNYGMDDLVQIIGKSSSHIEGSKQTGIEKEHKEDLNEEHNLDKITPDSMEEDVVFNKRILDFSKIGQAVILSMGAALGITAAIWFLFGVAGIGRFWVGPVAGGLICMFAVLINRKQEVRPQREPYEKEEQSHDWQMTFEEETTEAEPEEQEEEVMQTVLLTDTKNDENVKYLRASNPDMEDISISYVPFLIGKQEGLVDCVLDKEIISRIHVRIDREGLEYRISDLNSTNGTTVNGRLLETNETVTLKTGDEIFIANYGYIFT